MTQMNVNTFINFVWSMPNNFTDRWSWRKTGLRISLKTQDFKNICLAYVVYGTDLDPNEEFVLVSMTSLAKSTGYTIDQIREARNVLVGFGIFKADGKKNNTQAYRLVETDLVREFMPVSNKPGSNKEER